MKPLVVTDSTFSSEVLESKQLTVVDFWAAWCGPCRMIAPMVDQLAGQYGSTVKFTKLNVDENPDTAATYGVRSIPTLLFFRDGAVVDRIVGLHPHYVLEDHVVKQNTLVVQ